MNHPAHLPSLILVLQSKVAIFEIQNWAPRDIKLLKWYKGNCALTKWTYLVLELYLQIWYRLQHISFTVEMFGINIRNLEDVITLLRCTSQETVVKWCGRYPLFLLQLLMLKIYKLGYFVVTSRI